jgi:hypothetical protein
MTVPIYSDISTVYLLGKLPDIILKKLYCGISKLALKESL